MANHPADIRPDIVLNSPVGAEPAHYKWPLTYVSKGQKIDGAEEIVETIRWVGREFLELKPAIENLLPGQPDSRSYDCIKSLCDRYNKILETIVKMNKGTSVAPKTSSRASQGLLKHIIQQVYNYAVADPTELNKYSPFSSETYGETNFDFMAQLIERNQFRPREQDIFIDMGSGVGHLVLQMAASIECKKCYGIEISDVPAGYAKVMTERFKFWMSWYGKTYSEFELFHGNFFDKQYVDIIKNAAYILVNNYAFKPEVDHKLKQRFLDLKDGVQILSSKPFCSPKHRVSERHLTDIGSIMKVHEILPELKKDTVSWTPKPLPYYLHVLDASPLEKFYERKKRRQGRSSERGRPSKRRKGTKGSDDTDDSDDNVVYGPTTRKAWSEWCNSTSASNRASTDSVKSSRNNSTDTENYESAIEVDSKETVSKAKENESQKKDKRTQDTQVSASERNTATSQGTSAQTKSSQSANQAAKSCLDKKRDYASKKTTNNSTQNEKSYSCLTKSTTEAPNGASPSKVPPLVIKVTPPVETKNLEETEKGVVPSKIENQKQETKPKVNDENGKQLRQRKKSTTTQQTGAAQASTSSTKGAKSEPKASQSTAGTTANSTGNVTRGSKRVQQANSTKPPPKAPAVRSRKKTAAADKSLDLLHAKTVESVSGSAGYFPQPAPGCEDHSLRAIVETPSLPKVVVKNTDLYVNEITSQKMIEKLTTDMKDSLDHLARRFHQPADRASLERNVWRERSRHSELSHKLMVLELQNRELEELNNQRMRLRCMELGVKPSPRSLVMEIGNELKKREAYLNQLESFYLNQRPKNPPAAHSSNSSLSSPYRGAPLSATLDLSLKQGS